MSSSWLNNVEILIAFRVHSLGFFSKKKNGVGTDIRAGKGISEKTHVVARHFVVQTSPEELL